MEAFFIKNSKFITSLRQLRTDSFMVLLGVSLNIFKRPWPLFNNFRGRKIKEMIFSVFIGKFFSLAQRWIILVPVSISGSQSWREYYRLFSRREKLQYELRSFSIVPNLLDHIQNLEHLCGFLILYVKHGFLEKLMCFPAIFLYRLYPASVLLLYKFGR